MRIQSVHQIKMQARGKHCKGLQPAPREGSGLRQVYDLFVSSPGKPVEFMTDPDRPLDISKLVVTYGLDLRLLKRGDKRRNRISIWCMVGEWFGSYYIDYTAENDEQMDRLAEARYALVHIEHPENILPAGVHILSKDSIDILERVAAHGREVAAKHAKKSKDIA